MQVAELEGLFGALRADVEALFMQAPSVDMDALAEQARDMRLHAAEQVICQHLQDAAFILVFLEEQ